MQAFQALKDAATLLFLLLLLLTVRIRPAETSTAILGEIQAGDQPVATERASAVPEPLVAAPASSCEMPPDRIRLKPENRRMLVILGDPETNHPAGDVETTDVPVLTHRVVRNAC